MSSTSIEILGGPYPNLCTVQSSALTRSGVFYNAYGGCAAPPPPPPPPDDPPPSSCGALPSGCTTSWDANCCCLDSRGWQICL